MKNCLRRQQGASLLEFGIVTTIFAVICVVLLHGIIYYEEQAEKVVMESTVRNIRSALRVEVAHWMIHQRQAAIPQLALENPIKWLSPKPVNCIREFSGAPANPPKGSWYFDVQDRSLVHIVNLGKHFVADSSSPKQVRYRVVLVYEQQKEDRSVTDKRVVEEVVLVQSDAYRWF